MSQLRELGYSTPEVQRLRRDHVLVSLRRGVYVDRNYLDRLDAMGRHRLDAIALLRVLQQPAVASHVTAGVLLGMPMLRPRLDLLHVTRAGLAVSRQEAGVHHHAAMLPEDHLIEVDGLSVTSLARTAVDIARVTDYESAVAAVDSALRAGVTREYLGAVFDVCRCWPGARNASRAVAFGDGRAANPGESLSRVVLAAEGLPAPELQQTFVDGDGIVGTVDFCWRRQRVVGEFDGRLKYRVTPEADADLAGEVVWQEKLREDRLRDMGMEVVRWTWDDLERPAVLAARVRRAIARATSPAWSRPDRALG